MEDKPDDPQFPDGKLNDQDDGAIKTGIGISDDRVVIVWDKAITWLGFDPDSADEFADLIKEKAAEVRLQLER